MKVVNLDCSSISTKKELHKALATAMDFPDWYGNNLDALFDCLTELSESTLLQLENWEQAAALLGDYAANTLQTMEQAAEENPDFRVRM